MLYKLPIIWGKPFKTFVGINHHFMDHVLYLYIFDSQTGDNMSNPDSKSRKKIAAVAASVLRYYRKSIIEKWMHNTVTDL